MWAMLGRWTAHLALQPVEQGQQYHLLSGRYSHIRHVCSPHDTSSHSRGSFRPGSIFPGEVEHPHPRLRGVDNYLYDNYGGLSRHA